VKKTKVEHSYSKAEIRFIEKHITGIPYSKLTELFNKRFGTSLTVMHIKSAANHRKLFNGLPPFRFPKGYVSWITGTHKCNVPPEKRWQKGYTPYNVRPIGAERLKRGWTEIKVSKTRWKMKHVVIWEKANGPVPKDHLIIFADRDKTNFALENLLLISRRELGVMNGRRLIYENADYTRIGKAIADVFLQIGDRKRGNIKRRPGGKS